MRSSSSQVGTSIFPVIRCNFLFMRGLNEAQDLTLSEELVREVSGLRGAGGGAAAGERGTLTSSSLAGGVGGGASSSDTGSAVPPASSSHVYAHRHSLECQDMAHRSPLGGGASATPRPLSQALPSSPRAGLMSPPSTREFLLGAATAAAAAAAVSSKTSSHDSSSSAGGGASGGAKLSSASSQTLKDESPSILSPPLIGNLNDFASSSLLRHPSLAMTKLINRSRHPPPPSRRESASFAAEATSGALSPLLGVDAGASALPPALVDAFAADWVFTVPVIKFIVQRHDLPGLSTAMKQAIRKTSCRVFALQAFNWLLRIVTHSSSLHDIVWSIVAALTPKPPAAGDAGTEGDGSEGQPAPQPAANLQQQKQQPSLSGANDAFVSLMADEDGRKVCEHPLSDIFIAGDATQPLRAAFHSVLQTVADVMMHVPAGGPLQQMMMRLWALNFQPADHTFLHHSHVFNNISQILSKSESGWDAPASIGGAEGGVKGASTASPRKKGVSGNSKGKGKYCGGPVIAAADPAVYAEDEATPIVHSARAAAVPRVEMMQDLTKTAEVKASSRQAMVASLVDNSTETFWESGDEDRYETTLVHCGPEKVKNEQGLSP